jgi:hypothetical protein
MRKILKTLISIVSFIILAVSCNNIKREDNKLSNPTTDTLQIPKDSSVSYFPIKLKNQDSISNSKALNAFETKWFSQMLFALQEPTLLNYSGNIEIFRFTWLRTFHNPIAIRIQKQNDTISLILKVSNGQGGYNPGHIITDKTINITITEWNNFINKIEQIDFWNLSVRDPGMLGNDGAEWILEGVFKNKYHFTTRWSPGQSEYGKCCRYLIELSKIEIPKEDQY